MNDDLADKLRHAVSERFESEQIPALARLVDLPSHTYAPADVEAAALALDELAEQTGLVTQYVSAQDERFADHRIYTPAGQDDDARTPALVGHVDTVFPRTSGFLTYAREDDVARGPGVLDMKSGLTVIVFALRAVRAVTGSLPPVRFVCVTDEEVGSPTGRAVYATLSPHLTEALVFEHGRAEDRIITSRKGGGAFRIEARGRAAHAGNDHPNGVNAIHALALVVPEIEALTDYDRGITLNVGLFEGGTAKNTVPESASCIVDVRFVSAADGEEVSRRIREIIERPSPVAGATLTMSGGISRPPMEKTPQIDALRARYERSARAVGLGTGEAPRQGGFSDANLLAAAGVPTIDGLGPAGAGAHSTEEYCEVRSLLARTQALALFLADGQ